MRIAGKPEDTTPFQTHPDGAAAGGDGQAGELRLQHVFLRARLEQLLLRGRRALRELLGRGRAVG